MDADPSLTPPADTQPTYRIPRLEGKSQSEVDAAHKGRWLPEAELECLDFILKQKRAMHKEADSSGGMFTLKKSHLCRLCANHLNAVYGTTIYTVDRIQDKVYRTMRDKFKALWHESAGLTDEAFRERLTVQGPLFRLLYELFRDDPSCRPDPSGPLAAVLGPDADTPASPAALDAAAAERRLHDAATAAAAAAVPSHHLTSSVPAATTPHTPHAHAVPSMLHSAAAAGSLTAPLTGLPPPLPPVPSSGAGLTSTAATPPPLPVERTGDPATDRLVRVLSAVTAGFAQQMKTVLREPLAAAAGAAGSDGMATALLRLAEALPRATEQQGLKHRLDETEAELRRVAARIDESTAQTSARLDRLEKQAERTHALLAQLAAQVGTGKAPAV